VEYFEHASIEAYVPVQEGTYSGIRQPYPLLLRPQLLPVEYGQCITDIGGRIHIEPVQTHRYHRRTKQRMAVHTGPHGPVLAHTPVGP
jgi:hypothetical protein